MLPPTVDAVAFAPKAPNTLLALAADGHLVATRMSSEAEQALVPHRYCCASTHTRSDPSAS